jgi:hypothetical protein
LAATLTIEVPLHRLTAVDDLRAASQRLAKARIELIATQLDVPTGWIADRARWRQRKVAVARALIAYTLRRYDRLTLVAIGAALGVGHAQVLYILKRAPSDHLRGFKFTAGGVVSTLPGAED